ncbi:MAG: hypothetical protein IKQ33_03400 [Clostridia bacterium]|nr:hypothetical protein [Clostridia bacterium]
MNEEKNNKRLLSLVKPIINRLSDERKRYLEEEFNNVIKYNQSAGILMAYDIVQYLKKNKKSYLFRGSIDSSYIAYELGISCADCFELNIIPEQCFGLHYDKIDSICFNVGSKVQAKVLKHIDNVYKQNIYRFYSISPNGNIRLDLVTRLYIIDNTKKYDIKVIYQNGIGYKCLKAEDILNDNNIIKIIPFGHPQNDLIDDTLKLIMKHNNKIINYDYFKELNDKSKYINQLCNYSYLNINKLYCFEFCTDHINEMIKELKPTSFNNLVKISSLCRSINDNNNKSDINNIISTRDDVYDYLINNGFSKEEAFQISEMVRKGKFKEISESLNDRLPIDVINTWNKISYLYPRGHVSAYVNQDIFTMYLLDNYPNEISESYLKQYKNYDYFNKSIFCDDKNQLIRFIDFFNKEKELAEPNYKWKYEEIIKGLKFRILLIEHNISEENLLVSEYEYKNRNQQIEELRKNKVNKEEYLNRLKSIYTKRGIEKTFEDQYLNGEGHELDSKFFSPISSSRLCFELFSWMANDENIIDIEFEYYLPGLKSMSGHTISQPNMDVYYENEDINFVESKFTEQSYNKQDELSKKYYDYYLEENNTNKSLSDIAAIRFYGNHIFAKYFIEFVNDIFAYCEENDLFNKKDWFDLKQEITHIFGIGQYIYIKRPTKNINFTNLVYLFDDFTSKLAKQFKVLVVQMMNNYINELGLKILFFYNFESMQDYVRKIDINKNAFGTNRKIKDILKEYKLLEI